MHQEAVELPLPDHFFWSYMYILIDHSMWLMHLRFLIAKNFLCKWLVHAASKMTLPGRHPPVGVPLHKVRARTWVSGLINAIGLLRICSRVYKQKMAWSQKRKISMTRNINGISRFNRNKRGVYTEWAFMKMDRSQRRGIAMARNINGTSRFHRKAARRLHGMGIWGNYAIAGKEMAMVRNISGTSRFSRKWTRRLHGMRNSKKWNIPGKRSCPNEAIDRRPYLRKYCSFVLNPIVL
jgi:hypothetical protein